MSRELATFVAGLGVIALASCTTLVADIALDTDHAEAAPAITRMVQVWDRPAQVSIGVAVDRTNRLRCVSVVTGAAPAVVSVSIGRTVILSGVRVKPRTETGCVALPKPVTVGPNAWVYTRSRTTAPVRRTRLP